MRWFDETVIPDCGTQKFLLFKEMLGDIDASSGGGLGGGLFGPKAPRNKYNL